MSRNCLRQFCWSNKIVKKDFELGGGRKEGREKKRKETEEWKRRR